MSGAGRHLGSLMAPSGEPAGAFLGPVTDDAHLRLRIKRLLVSSLRLEGLAPETIDDDGALFGAGLGLDSVDALEMVVALEREFGIAIASEEVGRENFASVRALATMVASLSAERSPA